MKRDFAELYELSTRLMAQTRPARALIHIRDDETGEVVIHEEDTDLNTLHDLLFEWLENNYSCDCNRKLYWMRAKGYREADPGECHCGDTRYSITNIEPLDDQA